MRPIFTRISVGIAVATITCASLAQQTYPSKPITLVVPFAAGASADLIARTVGRELSTELGQPVVVDNKPGAGGALGLMTVARAPADGYTLGLGATGAIAVAPHLPDAPPLNPQRDLIPIGKIADIPLVLVASSQGEFRDLKSFLNAARKQPGGVSYGHAGQYTSQHLAGELLADMANVRLTPVPYKGSGPAVTDLTDHHPFWFQLYVMRDRSFIERLINRAKDANCSALMLTLDLQVPGQRHKDKKNGLSTPPKLTLRNMADLATKPRWCLGMLSTPRRHFGNIVGHVEGVENMSSLSEWSRKQFDPTLSWSDVAWIKKCWGGKLILKGILDADDARLALETGADAIVVSNHGGRQLDGAPSSIAALPAVIDAVGKHIEVHMDGGIRSGQDVLKALALGAKGTYIGRAMLYGLGAMGEAGVDAALRFIQTELDLSMALCGRTRIQDIDRDVLLPRAGASMV